MNKQEPEKDCRGCRYWYPPPDYSGESNRVGWCHRPITYFVNGKYYAGGIPPKTSAVMHCDEWKPKDNTHLRLRCGDIAGKCDCVVHGETEEEIFLIFGKHLKTVHGIDVCSKFFYDEFRKFILGDNSE